LGGFETARLSRAAEKIEKRGFRFERVRLSRTVGRKQGLTARVKSVAFQIVLRTRSFSATCFGRAVTGSLRRFVRL
jgi:hypothetical protein